MQKLAYKKKQEPEKYDRNHSNHPSNKKFSTSNQTDNQANQTSKMIQAIKEDFSLVIDLKSQQAKTKAFEFLVDNGASLSLVCYQSLTEETIKKINNSYIKTINSANRQPEETLGKLAIRLHNKDHIYKCPKA